MLLRLLLLLNRSLGLVQLELQVDGLLNLLLQARTLDGVGA
jgi:hypothetical protein